ncbi:glycosyl hydrolase [Hymenobacter lutimineralis]|uniref:Glycosyl hydrolase n=1 Tax=Hymenobacter lutimineralis TaxID=2606448 RepID=A0A5D6UY72_9BACT|nr:glycoside hydrolase family 30 protein [Hymenobacter lutimineralis]TYZ07449.1 glycosyl hydrolase [Hymenobacter lutimineralis]
MFSTRFFLTTLGLGAALVACSPQLAKTTSSTATAYTGPTPNVRQAEVYVTAQNTNDRLARKAPVSFEPSGQPGENVATLFVDYRRTFQTIVGIGGAFTDASAETFYKLPKAKQQEILSAYFDKSKGIGYSLGRTHINSCDFSSDMYTYVAPGDTALTSFSLAHDEKFRLPFIREALKTAGGAITMYASPWSPPAWMKTNDNMLQGGKLRPEHRRAWARYYSRFVKEYEKAGVPIWGLTVQNEPLAVQTWESCIYTADEEASFVKNFLGPELRRSGLDRLKLMIWDHNRGPMVQRAAAALNDPETAQYVWGTAFHWYMDDNYENVQQVHDAWPDKHLLFTEGCLYPFDFSRIKEWQWGEKYGESIIQDLNNWSDGWTDWNMILDEKGGPNHVQNYCYAPIIADTRTGDVHYMNSFYYIGHFSKFVRPGAKRIVCSSFSGQLQATAFLNTDGNIAVVAMNKGDKAVDFQLLIDGKAARTTCPAHGIVTMSI